VDAITPNWRRHLQRFGSKSDPSYEIVVAKAALPRSAVKICLTREEVFYCTVVATG